LAQAFARLFSSSSASHPTSCTAMVAWVDLASPALVATWPAQAELSAQLPSFLTDGPFSPGGCFAGQVVLARYGGSDRFCWARVLRVYGNRDGVRLCNVEWLRPPAEDKQTIGCYVCEDSSDDTDHCWGLLVDADLRLPPFLLPLQHGESFLPSDAWTSTRSNTSTLTPEFGTPSPRREDCDSDDESYELESRDGAASYHSFKLVDVDEQDDCDVLENWSDLEESEESVTLCEYGEHGCGKPSIVNEVQSHRAVLDAVVPAPIFHPGVVRPALALPRHEPLMEAPKIQGPVAQELDREFQRVLSRSGRFEAYPKEPLHPEPPTATVPRTAIPEPLLEVPTWSIASSAYTLNSIGTSESCSSLRSGVQPRDALMCRLYAQLLQSASGMALASIFQAFGAVLPQFSCMDHEMLLAAEASTELDLGNNCTDPEMVEMPLVNGRLAGTNIQRGVEVGSTHSSSMRCA